MPTTKAKSNVALLTEGAAYIQRAKKARKEQVEEIKFDDEARRWAIWPFKPCSISSEKNEADLWNPREWLTGFSKRKKAKAEEKKARAKERERQEHLEERRNVSLWSRQSFFLKLTFFRV